MSSQAPPPDAAHDALQASLALANRTIRRANRQIKTLQERIGAWDELGSALADIAAKLPKPRRCRFRSQRRESESDAVLLLSDAHANEQWTASQTDGYTSYDFDHFCCHLWSLGQSVIDFAHEDRRKHGLRTLHIHMLGDMLHGTIRPEDEVTNHFPMSPALANTAWVLWQWVRMLSEHFEQIEIVAMAGNHGRLKPKKRAKLDVVENLDTVVNLWLQSLIRSHGIADRVHMAIPASRKHICTRLGHRTLLAHGDHIRGGNSIAGIPIFGLSREILREFKKEAVAARKERIKLMEFGHFHQSNMLGDILFLNGELAHTDPYAIDEHGALDRPKQWFYYTSPRHVYGWQMPISIQAHDMEHGLTYGDVHAPQLGTEGDGDGDGVSARRDEAV